MNHRIAHWLAVAALLLGIVGSGIAGDRVIPSIGEFVIDVREMTTGNVSSEASLATQGQREWEGIVLI